MKTAPVSLAVFVREYCQGKQYDSCTNSPCLHSSPHGCQHPMHPRRAHAAGKLPPLPIHLMEGDTALEQRGEHVLVTFGDGSQRLVIGERLRPGTVSRIINKAKEPPVGSGRLAHFLPRVTA